jgi:FkbM family methyltransferase
LSTVTVEIQGTQFRIYDFDSLAILEPGFERFADCWLKPSPGENFLDVGAHVGKYAVSVAKLVGEKGKVIAIEPNPVNYNILIENIALNHLQNVIALNIGAWNEEGELKLFRSNMTSHHSIKSDQGLGFDVIHVRPLEDVLIEMGINQLDWVKIDTEGSELEVLEGLRTTFHRCKNIIAEVANKNIEQVKSLVAVSGHHGIIQISGISEDHVYLLIKHF